MRRALFTILATVLALVPAGLVPVSMADVIGSDGDRWEEQTFSGLPPTEYLVKADGMIQIMANASSSLIHRELTEAERAAQSLSWEWRVSAPVPPTDLTRKGADDRAVAVHVWFPDKGGGLFSGLGRAFARMSGKTVPGKVISYTWGGTAPPGSVLVNPFMKKDGVIIVLRGADAPTGHWLREEVDFTADFERVFGHAPKPPMGIAISGDSDDTGSSSRAAVRGIMFLTAASAANSP